MIKNKKLIISLVLATSVLVFTGCAQKTAPTTAQVDEAVIVKTAKANTGNINAIAVVTGKIAARQEVNITPKMPGKVAEVPVEVGSGVKKGQVVLKLDVAEVTAQVKQAEAGYAAARANYLKVKAGARPEQLNQTKANLAQAEANYKKNLTDLERMQELFKEGAISEQTLEGQKVAFTAAEAQYNNAKEALAMMEKGETAETFQVLEAQMEQAKAVLDLQKANQANAVIASPINGIIGARNVDAGEIASSAVPAVVIIDIDTVQVETSVTESQVNKLLVGQEVEVKVSAASSKTLVGKIKTVSPLANQQNKMYPIKIVIENKGHSLKPGMFAEISLPVEKKEGVLLIPREAITELNSDKIIYIVNAEGKVEAKKVDIGLSDGVVSEVLGGIDAGVTVVTTGLQNLQNGTKVRVQN